MPKNKERVENMEKVSNMKNPETSILGLHPNQILCEVFNKMEEMITKTNEIIEVINSLEHDDPKTASIQNRGGSNA